MYPKNVLVIHAHPDDTEAFCAGTLKLLADRGFNIHIATITAGGMGGVHTSEEETVTIRKQEATTAASMVGAAYYCLGGRDSYLFDTVELRIAATTLIRKVKAGIVFTHLPNDYHSDHRTTAQIVEIATMGSTLPNLPCKEEPLENTPLLYHTAPLGYSDPMGGGLFDPNFFVDISESIDTKREMLQCHQSQVELMRVMHNIDDFFAEMKQYNVQLGKMVGVPYAEAYWQHLGGGIPHEPIIQEALTDVICYSKVESRM